MSPAAEKGDSAGPQKRGRKASTASKSASRPREPRRSPVRLDRLRSGDAIALASAVLLFVLMFLDWWEVGTGVEQGSLVAVSLFDRGQDAWQALEVIPLFLMLAIVVAVGAALLRLVGSDWKPAIPPAAAVTVLGLLAALLILIRMISPPELAPSDLAGTEFAVSLQLPIFLALAAALGIAYGGWRAMGQEGSSFAGIAKRLESPRRPRPKSTVGPKPSGRAKP
ncbi:MAG TPA: hypothetical protein VGC32_00730 [Solirubrobacterales bacterium]